MTTPGIARTGGRVLVALVAMSVLLVGFGSAAAAHPLGNLSVNTFSRLLVEPDALRVEVVVDAAEIPTLQDVPDVNELRGEIPAPRVAEHAARRCDELRETVTARVNGEDIQLQVSEVGLTFPEGSAGLHTSRLTCALSSTTALTLPGSTVDYTVSANADRVGWREVIAAPSGVHFASSDVPDTSPTKALTIYPEDLLSSPLDRSEAHVVVAGTGSDMASPLDLTSGPAAMLPRGVDRFTVAFTGLVARQHLTMGFGLLAVLIAMVLGGLHAFAPGHGKTVMAAYLIGSEGSWRQAAVVGTSVTATHTLGVLVLGLALTTAGLASPERVYPWLGTASGLLMAGIGVGLLRRSRVGGASAVRPDAHAHTDGATGHHDHHSHDGEGAHDDHEHGERHSHGVFSHTHLPPARSIRGLIAVGFAGGLVPSPSALLVLLGGIALGRAWFGTLLVLAYGVGMALALMATGLLLVSARDAFGRLLTRSTFPAGRRALRVVGRGLPTVTASMVVLVGLGIAVRSVVLL